MQNYGLLAQNNSKANPMNNLFVFSLSGIALTVWCFPDIPAIRYSTLTLLLILILPIIIKNLRNLIKFPIFNIYLLWVLYLAIWPLLSMNPSIAIASWKSEWLIASLTGFSGLGVGIILSSLNEQKNGIILTRFAWFSLTPCILHLIMTIGVWFGFITLNNAGWTGYSPPIMLQAGVFGTTDSFPWGYWGVHRHHADLGYASLSALIFIGASLKLSNKKKGDWLIFLAIVTISLASTLIAHSRASILFIIITSIFIVTININNKNKFPILKFATIILLLSVLFGWIAMKTDNRWAKLSQSFSSAMHIKDPAYVCLANNSLPSAEKSDIDVSSYSRFIFASIGFYELLKHPWGYDGSRSSFNQLSKEYCPPNFTPPAHAHNGWIDLGLAIGVLGMLIWLLLLTSGLVYGWYFRKFIFGRGLLLCSAILIFRALVDSIFRDHMLEMWSFTLLLFIGALMPNLRQKIRYFHQFKVP